MSINNIKSSYLVIILFSHFDEKRKLKIINYNKAIQNLLDINIINYKIFSGKYIKYESNGKAKEYDIYHDLLIFEGEYLNGKRNGKGKEYFLTKELRFEGEYLNGKRNGNGKEYYCTKPLYFFDEYLDEKNSKVKEEENFNTKILRFEGEYLNGKKWNGKGYDKDGSILNELKNGNGFIKEYDDYSGDLLFEGEYKNGERNGKGTLFDEYGIIFDGEYLDGKEWNGKFYDEGNIICELKDGKGIRKEYNRNNNILRYEGEYLNGLINGKVRKFDYNGKLTFEGEYINGILNGAVKEYDNEGQIKFEGECLYGDKRKGKEYINGRLEYEGEYLFRKKWTGKGYDEKGNTIYEIINGTGKVKEYNIFGGLIFEGEYKNGKRNGKCNLYDGLYTFEREYLDGKICKEIVIKPEIKVDSNLQLLETVPVEIEYID